MKDSLYLIDTSVWLEVLPARQRAAELRERVDALLAADRVATTGMVLLELLSGIGSEVEYRRRRQMLLALHLLRVQDERWEEAARLGSQLRRQGVTIPFTDLLIAAVALSAGAVVLHQDRHFDLVARHAPLTVESHLPASGESR